MELCNCNFTSIHSRYIYLTSKSRIEVENFITRTIAELENFSHGDKVWEKNYRVWFHMLYFVVQVFRVDFSSSKI